MKVLITSGGTRVPIDDVRYIGNMSTGRYGAELARVAYKAGLDVTLFHAKDSVTPFLSYNYSDEYHEKVYKDYNEYKRVVDLAEDTQPDIIISAAAVSDYIVDKTEGKISSDGEELIIRLKKAKKILPEFKKVCPNALVVGFKLLVSPKSAEIKTAVQKVLDNGADLCIFNDLTRIRQGDDTRYIFSHGLKSKPAKDSTTLINYIIEKYNERTSRTNG